MSQSFSVDIKDQIRRAVDIVDLVGSYLSLSNAGANFKALCPWHDDRRPSLQVNPQRQTFKCWVCNIGGDIFTFVQQMEGVSFPEAVRMLAERAGISMENASFSGLKSESADEKALLYAAMAWAERCYETCLRFDPQAELARDYLLGRGIPKESWEKFHLGFAPLDWEWLQKQPRPKDITLKSLETAGVVVARRTGNGLFDRFRGRVLFPIRDPQGRPIALGGRVVPGLADNAEETAKYVNTADTPLFSKNRVLYALECAKGAIRKQGMALVMEGYTDCILAHQHGLENAVAVLGTALGERHIRLLRGLAERVVLVLDGDQAGQRRANEILELFVAANVDLRILTLPGELDPCDYLSRFGRKSLEDLVEKAPDALEHKLRHALERAGPNPSMHAAFQSAEEILSVLAKAPRTVFGTTSLREDQVLSKLSQAFSLPEARLRQRLAELAGTAPRPVARPAAPVVPPSSRECWLMEILLEFPHLAELAHRQLAAEMLEHVGIKQLYQVACDLVEAGELPTLDQLLTHVEDGQSAGLLVSLDESGRQKRRASAEEELLDLIKDFHNEQEKKWFRRQALAVKESAGDPSVQERLLIETIRGKQLKEQGRAQRQQGNAAPTDG